MTITIQEFTKQHSFGARMSEKGLDSWSNYIGSRDISDMVIVVSQTRDSEVLEQSNFAMALEMLGGESKDVQVHRFGHWACGWVESIMVNPKSKRKLKQALDIVNKIAEYPVLDDNDFYERENEYQTEYAEGAKVDLAEGLEMHFGIRHTKALEAIAIELNIECQRYAGNDSWINVYTCRKPDARDVQRLIDVMGQMYSKSVVFKRLVAAVKAYKVSE